VEHGETLTRSARLGQHHSRWIENFGINEAGIIEQINASTRSPQ
jgi:hypothetical protein